MARVFKFGDDIDTDVIISAKWAGLTNPAEFSRHCLETIAPDFSRTVRPGDVIVAGENFGCGSSRERAPLSIQGCGVAAIVAKSFARIFYRNAINIGLPLIECKPIFSCVDDVDPIEIELPQSVLFLPKTGQRFSGAAFPDFVQEIINSKGIVNYYKETRMNQLGKD